MHTFLPREEPKFVQNILKSRFLFSSLVALAIKNKLSIVILIYSLWSAANAQSFASIIPNTRIWIFPAKIVGTSSPWIYICPTTTLARIFYRSNKPSILMTVPESTAAIPTFIPHLSSISATLGKIVSHTISYCCSCYMRSSVFITSHIAHIDFRTTSRKSKFEF